MNKGTLGSPRSLELRVNIKAEKEERLISVLLVTVKACKNLIRERERERERDAAETCSEGGREGGEGREGESGKMRQSRS